MLIIKNIIRLKQQMYVTVRNKLMVYLGKNLSRITANVHGR